MLFDEKFNLQSHKIQIKIERKDNFSLNKIKINERKSLKLKILEIFLFN
jgi:hypothetical protein